MSLLLSSSVEVCQRIYFFLIQQAQKFGWVWFLWMERDTKRFLHSKSGCEQVPSL